MQKAWQILFVWKFQLNIAKFWEAISETAHMYMWYITETSPC